jgi:hypothetical protein
MPSAFGLIEMNRTLRLVSLLMLVASSLSFAASVYIASSWSWAPVELPLPGPALSVDETFDVTTSGTYRFEASVPIISPDAAMKDLPPVPSNLEVSIAPEDAPPRKYTLTIFRADSRGPTDLYIAEPQVALQRGAYTLRVQNKGVTQPFADRGAVLTLTRFVYPTEFYLQGVLFRGIGWVGLLCGVTVGVLSELLARRRPLVPPAPA